MKYAHRSYFILLAVFARVATPLTEVCFYHNSMADGVYIQCGSLKVTEQSREHEEVSKIESLQIGWNTSIPVLDYGLFTPFANLLNLTLSNVNIRKIGPRAFYNLGHLQKLDLYNNKIWEIDPLTFRELVLLRVLNLGQNRLEALKDSTFSNLHALEKLVLKWNNIENISRGTLNGLSSLRVLDLRGNRIAALKENVFGDLPRLEELDLSFNALTRIPAALFSNQIHLSRLNLESNDIDEIQEEAFNNTVNLKHFDISNNLLTRLDEELLTNTVVEVLKFSRNYISQMNATSLLLYCPFLDKIYLDFNPWNCDALAEIIDELQKNQIDFERGSKFKVENNIYGIECRNEMANVVW